MKRFHLTVLLALVSAAAAAHTKLEATMPGNDSIIETAPREIVLEFEGQVRLTALALQDAKGKQYETDSLPLDVGEKFAVGIHSTLVPGTYTVNWRAVGADTHIISGTFTFAIGVR